MTMEAERLNTKLNTVTHGTRMTERHCNESNRNGYQIATFCHAVGCALRLAFSLPNFMLTHIYNLKLKI